MNRLNDHKAAVETFFQERLQDVKAGELVSVLGTKKTSRPKLLVLSEPLVASGSLSGASGNGGVSTVSLVSIGKNNGLKIKQTFAADRLEEITHNGSFDATLNFGASGMLSVSFGSQIQRDMFLAVLKRFKERKKQVVGEGAGLIAHGRGVAPIRGVFPAAFADELDDNAASRVHKLHQERRRVFSMEEERHLLKFMGDGDFDDIKAFQDQLFNSQKKTELTSLNILVTSAPSWEKVQTQVIDLIRDVEDLEGCIERFSSNLLSKKAVIEEIEHANNALRCKQKNLKQLHGMMNELWSQLSLKPATQALLTRLQNEPDSNLIAFFSEHGNAEALSEAMKHMQQILHNPQLDMDYPIAAVADRKTYFLEQRRMVARRSRSYIFSIIENYERLYLSDRMRYSADGRLVWRLHTDLSLKLFRIAGIIQALCRIDMEGFASMLRKYRTSMQKVYHVEIYRYFKGLRKQIKKINPSSGPFLLGSSDSKAEGGIAISADLRRAERSGGGIPPLWRPTPLPSPALTPRARHEYDGGNSVSQVASAEGEDGGGGDDGANALSIEFPSSTLLNGIVLYPNCVMHRGSDSRMGLSCVIHCSHKLLRPDLTFAIALESTIACILQEELILRSCFGITEASSSDLAPTPAEVEPPRTSIVPSTSSSFSAFESDAPMIDRADKNNPMSLERQQEEPDLFIESLVELFGTDIARVKMQPPLTPRGDVNPKYERKSELGLPPRYPGSQGTPSVRSSLALEGHSRETSNSVFEGNGRGNAAHQALTPQMSHSIRSSFLVTELLSFVKFFAEKCDRIYSIVALCVIKAYRRNLGKLFSRSTFCCCLLQNLEKIVADAIMRFVAEQTESINMCRRRYMIRPTALLHCFAKMPALILRMEEIHNSLSQEARDCTQYATIVTSLVDQSFEALDAVTGIKNPGGANNSTDPDAKLNLMELLEKKLHDTFGLLNRDDNKTLKRNFIQQYRHHAFFCAFHIALPPGSYAAELLREHYESSKTKRNLYRDLYLTRVLFIKEFPVFGPFIVSAEDLSKVYSQEELQHHRSLTVEAVKKVLHELEKELRNGVRSSATRMKKHFLQDVTPGRNEESFHRTLLQRTWQHFSKFILRKCDFLVDLVQRPSYRGLTVPFSRNDMAQLLSSF